MSSFPCYFLFIPALQEITEDHANQLIVIDGTTSILNSKVTNLEAADAELQSNITDLQTADDVLRNDILDLQATDESLQESVRFGTEFC